MSMSKIEKEILKATGEAAQKRKEDGDAYRTRLVKAMHKLDDDEWEELSEQAQEWFNDAAEANNDKKQLPDFPGDAAGKKGKKEEKEEKIAPRKKKAGKKGKKDAEEEEEEEDTLEEGMEVIIYGNKDKVLAEGEVVEVGKKQVVVLQDDEEETSVSLSRMVRFEIVDAGAEDDGEEEEVDEEEVDEEEGEEAEEIDVEDLEVGQSVRLVVDEEEIYGEVTKTNKLTVFIDGEKYAKKDIEEAHLLFESEDDGEEAEGDVIEPGDVEKDMAVSIEMKDGTVVEGTVTRVAPKSGDPKTIFVDGTRCGVSKIVSITSSDGAEEEEGEEEEGDESADAVRDIICKFPKMKLDKIVAKVKKAKIDMDDDDVDAIYADTQTVIELLKAHGKLA